MVPRKNLLMVNVAVVDNFADFVKDVDKTVDQFEFRAVLRLGELPKRPHPVDEATLVLVLRVGVPSRRDLGEMAA